MKPEMNRLQMYSLALEYSIRGHQKKVSQEHFRIILTAWSKKNFCNEILGQRPISVPIFKISLLNGPHQKHEK